MENDLETDIDYNLDDPNAKSGVYGLWLHVLCISVCEYLHANKFTQASAFFVSVHRGYIAVTQKGVETERKKPLR